MSGRRIFTDEEVSADALRWIAINAELWPEITRRKRALLDADQWAQMRDEGRLLDRRAGRGVGE